MGNTNNYKNIACTAEFTVTEHDSPIGKSFVLTDVTAHPYASGEFEAPSQETVDAIAAKLKADNLNKTAICAADGKVTGTCNLGLGAFDGLTGDDAFTLTFDPVELRVEVRNGNAITLNGEYINETLTLSLQQALRDSNSGEVIGWYYLIFTFTLQTTVN